MAPRTLWPSQLDVRLEEAPKDSVEARRMKLDSSRALERLGWQPVWSADRSVDATVEWYVAYGERRDMRATTLAQIRSFEEQLERNAEG